MISSKKSMLLSFLSCIALSAYSSCGSTVKDSPAPPQQPGTVAPAASPNPAPAGSGTPTPAAAASFSHINSVTIQPKCLSCHRSGNNNGGYDYSTFAGVHSAAVAGNPDASPLYTSVASGSMPQGGPSLSASEIQEIHDWIAAGAPNN